MKTFVIGKETLTILNNVDTSIACDSCGREFDISEMCLAPAMESYYKEYPKALLRRGILPMVCDANWSSHLFCPVCFEKLFGR